MYLSFYNHLNKTTGYLSNLPYEIDLEDFTKLNPYLSLEQIVTLQKKLGLKIKCCCSEQGFMIAKAIYFMSVTTFNANLQLVDQMLNNDNPKIIKQLGRKVMGFDQKNCELVREEAMYINLLKKIWAKC